MSDDEMERRIKSERAQGLRDKYFIEKTYVERLNNEHYDDRSLKDAFQKDVYALALEFALAHGAQDIVDVGCGSGFKLVHMARIACEQR